MTVTINWTDAAARDDVWSARERMSLFCESDESTWDDVLGTNLKGVLYTCRAVIDHMLLRGTGNIVNIGSVAGMIGLAGQVEEREDDERDRDAGRDGIDQPFDDVATHGGRDAGRRLSGGRRPERAPRRQFFQVARQSAGDINDDA